MATQIHPLLGPVAPWVEANPVLGAVAVLLAVLLVGEALHRAARLYVLRFLKLLAARTQTQWDDAVLVARLPDRLVWSVPLLVWYYGVLVVPGLPEWASVVAQRVVLALMVVILVRSVDAALAAANTIYGGLPRARERPIKGFLQVANVVSHLAGLILVIAILMGRSPVIFLSGLGALTAVLLLVFRDTLLSLVAGIQITTNDLLRVGDWIEMPEFGADGEVADIALNSVTISNWDNTLTVIPTHKFLEHSFRNWRGMEESGGRRIKRSFHLDQSTVRFLTREEIERFSRWKLLGQYMAVKREEIGAGSGEEAPDTEAGVHGGRRLTNLGTLRAYIVRYLQGHPALHDGMTLIVRHLAPTAEGLPVEIYVFTSDTRWVHHEDVQADIFDHVLAMVPEFGLRIYQRSSDAPPG